jgi:hypothetical protein
VEKWAAAVVTLSTVAERYPQTVYAGFIFCMQNKWLLEEFAFHTCPYSNASVGRATG